MQGRQLIQIIPDCIKCIELHSYFFTIRNILRSPVLYFDTT